MTTRVYFAGVNTENLCAATEGRAILVSYADVVRRPGWWERSLLPRLRRGAYSAVMLDSGAFTVISAGISIDASEYAAFAAEYRELFDVVVGLDDIAGDLATTWRNLATTEAVGVDALPVFHQGEPWSVWDEIAFDAIEMCGGKAKRSDVVELVSDAGRLEDYLDREIERLGVPPRPTAFYEPNLEKRAATLAATREALAWWKEGSDRDSRLRIVRKAFPAAGYVI